MIIDNDGGKTYEGDDMPSSYSIIVRYTNSGRVEKRSYVNGQTSLIEDYGDPVFLKIKKQKEKTKTLSKQKYDYQNKYLKSLKEYLELQNKHLTLQNEHIALQDKYLMLLKKYNSYLGYQLSQIKNRR